MSNKYLIVIVEDEYNISSFVSAVLQAHAVQTAGDLIAAAAEFAAASGTILPSYR